MHDVIHPNGSRYIPNEPDEPAPASAYDPDRDGWGSDETVSPIGDTQLEDQDAVDGVVDTWDFVDLGPALDGHREPIQPTLLRRSDDRCLLYPGRINGVHADSGAGKGWIAAVACVEHLHAGGHAVWCDFEDPNEDLIIERLCALGIEREVLRERFHYVNPSEPAGVLTADRMVARLDGFGSCLVVIDSTGESLGLQGLDEDRDVDVDAWKRLIPHPFERAGHTLVLIDHSTKARDNPLHPSGSKRKRALISGASWNVEEITPFDRTHPGKLRLICAKDRQGNYRRKEVGAWVHVDPTGDRLTIALEAPADSDSRPDANAETISLLRRVVAAVRAAGAEGLGSAELRTNVRLKAKGVRNQAIDDCANYAAQIGAITITGGKPGVKKVHRFGRELTEGDLKELADAV